MYAPYIDGFCQQLWNRPLNELTLSMYPVFRLLLLDIYTAFQPKDFHMCQLYYKHCVDYKLATIPQKSIK